MIDPTSRKDIPPADSYGRGARVWVHRGGLGWRPGLVESATPVAALVTYRPTEHRGTTVDTVTAVHLASRTEEDLVDRSQPRPGEALLMRSRTPDHDRNPACQGLGSSR